jgi:hypothetical protein
MKKNNNKKKKETIHWFLWLLLVVLWNYSYPTASPLLDVLIAVTLSIFFIVIKKSK